MFRNIGLAGDLDRKREVFNKALFAKPYGACHPGVLHGVGDLAMASIT